MGLSGDRMVELAWKRHCIYVMFGLCGIDPSTSSSGLVGRALLAHLLLLLTLLGVGLGSNCLYGMKSAGSVRRKGLMASEINVGVGLVFSEPSH